MKKISALSIIWVALILTPHTAYLQSTKNIQAAMFRSGAALTGQSNEQPVSKLDGIKFMFKINAPIRSTPVAFDQGLYFGGGDGYFYALDAVTGEELWKVKTGGAIFSSPAADRESVYFSSRDGNIYCLQRSSGKLKWKLTMGKDLGDENYWDNYLSSPILSDDKVYIGSGDGNLYAIEAVSGKVTWKYNSHSRIRTAPAVYGDNVVFGNNAGYILDINKANGELKWKFATDGVNNSFESAGNDRKSVFCSASISDNVVVTGGRDGIVYGIDLNTGKELWRNNHKGPWILSTAVKDGIAYIGCGSDALVQALDLHSGAEKWRFKAASAVFSSITIAGDMLYFTDLHFSGNLHALTLDGKEVWDFPLGARSFSTPVLRNGMVYCATEAGVVYGLAGNTKGSVEPASYTRMVYYEGTKHPKDFKDFQNGIDSYLRDYFIACGYKLVAEDELEAAMKQQLTSHARSVIVFADNRFPVSITENKEGKPLVLQYMEAQGKIVIFGLNPIAYSRDSTGAVVAFDDSIPATVFGLKYIEKNLIRGIYVSHPTSEGAAVGLYSEFSAVSNPTVIEAGNNITILAKDEFGSNTEWIKNFGGPEGTGLLQLNVPSYEVNYNLGEMRAVIEKGICW